MAASIASQCALPLQAKHIAVHHMLLGAEYLVACLQDKEKWSKEKFEIANKAKMEAARLHTLEEEAQKKAQ